MDGDRFDTIVRSLAASRSRRSVIRTLAGSAAGGLLALAGRGVAGADPCKEVGKECKKGIQCCAGSCVPPTSSRSTSGSGSICCAPGQVQDPAGACCTPTTCAAQGKNCGTISDGCGVMLTCGGEDCAGFDTCGGGGVANVCGCTPATGCPSGQTCGTADDGCGGTLTCGSGTCAGGQTCQGGSCACPPGTCGAGCAQAVCGDASCRQGTSGACGQDGDCCSGACVGGSCQGGCVADAGACDTAADCCGGTCSGGVCCTPTTCAAQGKNCGIISDGCGNHLNCGGEDCGGQLCIDNTCQACRPLQAACNADLECCQDEQTFCADTGGCGASECCHPIRGSCTDPSGCDCCGAAVCHSGSCCLEDGAPCTTNVFDPGCCDDLNCIRTGSLGQGVCTPPCRPVGTACALDAQCCQGGDVTECGDATGTCCVSDFAGVFSATPTCSADDQCCSGFCYTRFGHCCRTEGAPCSKFGHFSLECCIYHGLTCSGENGSCIQCRPLGETCEGTETDSTCCLGSSCENGRCVQGSCNVHGEPCQHDSACCPGNRCNVEFAQCELVCAVAGQPCSLGCCPGLTCDDPSPLGLCRL